MVTPIKRRWSLTIPAFMVAVGCIIFFLLISGKSFAPLPTGEELKEKVFHDLEDIRLAKKREIFSYLKAIEAKAVRIVQDEVMMSFMDRAIHGNLTLDDEYLVDLRYVEEYAEFYDILFVDGDGTVRYSIKKESDYGRNLFTAPLGSTMLSSTLQQAPSNRFSEFEFYAPSGEPAAFFTIPASHPDGHKGWFVVQVAANSLNAVMTDRRGLGRTGEVYIVDERKMMLSDSRFFQKSTILRKEIVTEAVKLGFAEGKGQKIIEDYRGMPVFSSFEKVEIFGSSWLLIAEIDEAEVFTEFYKKHSEPLLEKIVNENGGQSSSSITEEGSSAWMDGFSRVDMNEFQKHDGSIGLVTYGVATCTAVAAICPGKVYYLAHLSPVDEIYLDNPIVKHLLGRKYTNLLSEMFAKMFYYDILPRETSEMVVVIVVPHGESVPKVINAALEQGVELHNILLMYDNQAVSANVQLNTVSEKVLVHWNYGRNSCYQQSSTDENLENAVKRAIGYAG